MSKIPFLYDLVDPQELNGFVQGLNFPEFALERMLPVRTDLDIDFRITKGNAQDVDTATWRTWTAESPIARRRGALTRIQGQLPPISRKIPLDEEDRLRLRRLSSELPAGLEEAIFGDAFNMTRAIHARFERARGELIRTGKLVLAENGITATVDFIRNGALAVAPGILWSAVATATIVKDITTWRNTYMTLNDNRRPGFALTSTRVEGFMLQNAEIRTLAASAAGTPGLVTRPTLDQVFNAFGLPPVVLYDTQVRVDGVATNVIPDDLFIFFPGPEVELGETAMGVSADAIRQVEAGVLARESAPGVTAVVWESEDPVITWTKASAVGIPLMYQPDAIMVADVL